jgi:hypothetical protein
MIEIAYRRSEIVQQDLRSAIREGRRHAYERSLASEAYLVFVLREVEHRLGLAPVELLDDPSKTDCYVENGHPTPIRAKRDTADPQNEVTEKELITKLTLAESGNASNRTRGSSLRSKRECQLCLHLVVNESACSLSGKGALPPVL